MKQVRQLLQYLAMVTTLTVIFGTFDYLRAANFFCSSGNTTCLIAAINSANGLRGKHTINLESGVYTLQIIDNATDGANGLPSIKRSIEIRGSTGDLPVNIERDPSAPSFSIFHIALGGELSLEGVNVRRRDIAATMFGGGVAIFNRGVTILHESIVSDSSSGIYNTGTLKILESIIANNHHFFGSGGIVNDGGTVLVENSTIAHNGAGARGTSGIDNTGSLTVRGSAIVFNFNGGDVFNAPVIRNSGSVEIINSTIAKNTAFYGPVLANDGVFSLTNSTVRENETFAEGAFPPIGWLRGTIEVKNTIVAGNNSTMCSGAITSLGNNLLDDRSCSINLQPSDLTGDPGIGTLIGTGDDDLPGRVYYPVLAGSAVIGKGDRHACTQRDQLGNRRIGICEIGAIEFIPPK